MEPVDLLRHAADSSLPTDHRHKKQAQRSCGRDNDQIPSKCAFLPAFLA